MNAEEYNKAKKSGERAVRAALSKGTYPYLPALDDLLENGEGNCSVQNLSVREIPLDLIVGTKTRARQNAFASNFMPLLDVHSEFAGKWQRVYDWQMEQGISDAVEVVEYLKRFYVVEGNKRVSVLKYLKVPGIEASIKRVLPVKNDDPQVELYYEFLEFYKICPIYDLTFSRPGGYQRFLQLSGLPVDTTFSMDTVRNVQACYYRFAAVFAERGGDKLNDVTPADALLVYLSVYTLSSLLDQTRGVLAERLKRLWKEITSLGSYVTLEQVEHESEHNVFSNLFVKRPVYNEAHPLKVAFVHTDSCADSRWVEEHEIGRMYLQNSLEGVLCSEVHENVKKEEDFAALMEDLKQKGVSMVFTTSSSLMPWTLKAAIEYPSLRFLNCSLHLHQHSVRTYYGRLYGARFLLGALAAQYAVNHQIGYVAHEPVYGEIADINAFAIGAACVDPNVRIHLAWDCVQKDWHETLQDVDVIYGPEYGVYAQDSVEHGLFFKKNGQLIHLGHTVLNWGLFYRRIVESVLDGSYDETMQKNNSISYWFGLSGDVVDVQMSASLSYYSRKFIAQLKEGLVQGTVQPFAGALCSQTGELQKETGSELDNEKIMTMSWLNDNVEGALPSFDELNAEAQAEVRVAGVTSALRKGE